MLKKTITYDDFNGVSCTEDFFFNLTEAEITQLQLSENGGYTEWVKSIANARDNKTLAKIFKDIIMLSYGEKSTDGKFFRKTDKDSYNLVNDFVQTEAFSKLYMELITDPDKAAEFMNGIMPESLKAAMAEQKAIEDKQNHPAITQNH